jgi:hypothetical protein
MPMESSMATTKEQLDAARSHERSFQQQWFHRFATATGKLAGKPSAFIAAAAIIIIWAATGPIFNYSDTWQLVINTGTTIITFLMVFLIQHSQNRDTRRSSQGRAAKASTQSPQVRVIRHCFAL